MQGTKARRTVILAAVAALSVAISGCAKSDRDSGGGSSASGQTSSKDTLVFGAAGDPKLFDPAFASDGETFRVLKQIGTFEYGGAGSFLAYLRSTLLNLLRN